jgi:hypothetical protein
MVSNRHSLALSGPWLVATLTIHKVRYPPPSPLPQTLTETAIEDVSGISEGAQHLYTSSCRS